MMAPLLAALAVSSEVVAREPEAPGFPTPAWRTPGALLLRTDPERPDGLLLAHSERPVVYRYLPGPGRLTTVDREVWERADGAAADCSAPSDPDPQRLRIDPRRGLLLAGERPVATARSPGGAWVAVASAAGPRSGALLPFLGGAGASGPHYHQVLRASDNVPVGPAVRIPLDSSRQVLSLCWSGDERHVVYHDYWFTQAVIIPFRGVSGKER
jgi:hypothetical protein